MLDNQDSRYGVNPFTGNRHGLAGSHRVANSSSGRTCEPCPADLDGSGSVDFDDLLIVLSEWGDYKDCPPFIPADIDQDCDVDFDDLLIVLAAWGPCE